MPHARLEQLPFLSARWCRRSWAHRYARIRLVHGQTSNPGITPVSQPTVTSEDGFKTLRTRREGHKSLPLPPILDPIAMEAKERFKKTKPDQDYENLTELQKELAMNPYAQALATDVRCCQITQARLPAHFLVAFSSVYERSVNAPDNVKAARPRIAPSSTLPLNSEFGGGKSYVVNRQDMLEHLRKKSRWTTIVTRRMSDDYAKRLGNQPGRTNVRTSWKIEPDMLASVLSTLQQVAFRKIKKLAEHHKELFVPLKEGLETSQDFCCVLDFGVASEHDVRKDLRHYNVCELLGDIVPAGLPEHLQSAMAWGLVSSAKSVRVEMELDRICAYTDGNRVTEI